MCVFLKYVRIEMTSTTIYRHILQATMTGVGDRSRINATRLTIKYMAGMRINMNYLKTSSNAQITSPF